MVLSDAVAEPCPSPTRRELRVGAEQRPSLTDQSRLHLGGAGGLRGWTAQSQIYSRSLRFCPLTWGGENGRKGVACRPADQNCFPGYVPGEQL